MAKKPQLGIDIRAETKGEEKVAQLSQRLRDVEKAGGKKIPDNTGPLRQGAERTSGVFKRLTGVVAGVGAALTAAFTVRGVLSFLKSATLQAGNFQEQIAKVGAVSGASAEDLDRMADKAREMGSTTAFTALEAAQGMESLARAGLNAGEAVETIPSVLALAQGNSLGLAEAATFVTRAISGMGLAVGDAARVSDVLAKAAASANTDVSGLAQALSYAAPAAQALDLPLENTVAFIGKLADAGIDASRAGTSLNNIFSQFKDTGSAFRRELSDMGITTNDFEQAMRELEAAGADGEEAILAIGLNAGPSMRALLSQGIGAVDELTGTLRNAGGASQEMADRIDATLPGAIRGLGSAWSALRGSMGQALLEPVTEQVVSLANKIREFTGSEDMERLKEIIVDAFDRGVEAIKGFIGEVGSIDAVITRTVDILKGVSTQFGRVQAVAVAAGNAIRGAYEVVNTVVSGLTTALSAALTVVAGGFSAIMRGLRAVGAVSEEAALKAEAAYETLQETTVELGKRTVQAAEDVKSAAGDTLAAIQSLGDASEELGSRQSRAAEEAKKLKRHALEAAEGVFTTAESFEAWAKEQDKVTAAQEEARKETDLTTASTAELRDLVREAAQHYHELIDAGAGQVEVAEAAGHLRDAQRELATAVGEGRDAMLAAQRQAEETAAAVDDTAVSTKDVTDAFEGLGVTSQAALEAAAREAKKAFDVVESAEAPVKDLQAAFVAYAETAIAANKGVADETLRAKAEALGLRAVLNEKFEVTGFEQAAEAVKRLRLTLGEIGTGSKKAEDGLGKVGTAAEDAAEKTKGASHQAKQATAEWFQAVLNDGIEITRRWGAAVEQLFHKLRGATDAAHRMGEAQRQAAGDVEWFRDRARHLEQALVDVRRVQQTMSAGTLTRWAAKSSEASYRAEQAYIAQRIAMEDLIAAAEDGGLTMAELDRATDNTRGQLSLLNDADLKRLHGAIDGARNRMQSLRDSAEDTLESLQDELLQLQGREDELEQRRLDRRRAEIEAQIALADGDYQAVQRLRESLGVLEKISSERRAQADAVATERREREAMDRADRDTAPRSAAPASTTPTQTVRWEINANGRRIGLDVAPGQESAMEALLRELEIDGMRMQ